MLVRQPVVAGRFYPGDAQALEKEVKNWLGHQPESTQYSKAPWAFMLPHAGYIFCGNVIGKTLNSQPLPPRLVILCPNHTGRGAMLSVWPAGKWLTPLGPVDVDETLATQILESGGGFAADTLAHLGEHSIEVLLPFLQEQRQNISIVPICVGIRNRMVLEHAGHALATVLKKSAPGEIGLIVSSDMNHYENEALTLKKDDVALARALKDDPDGLLDVVEREQISMCGAGPLALALYTARDMGGADVELIAHETSGKASGDLNHTVGYAGLRIYLGAA